MLSTRLELIYLTLTLRATVTVLGLGADRVRDEEGNADES